MDNYYVWRLTSDAKEFSVIISEIIAVRRLHQGWGFPGMDMRHGEESIFQVWPYVWGNRDECHNRYGILKPMLEIEKGDVILIPKLDLTSLLPSDNHFTIAFCQEGYNFKPLNLAKRDDYGHFITLQENIRSFSYQQDANTKFIEEKMKNIAYSKAVNRIVNDNKLIKALDSLMGN